MGFFHACKEVVTQMASRIQGITVEIGGDTTKLSKALESVNKSIKGTQSGLKDVNKLLKLDPSNTELVVQKQKMLIVGGVPAKVIRKRFSDDEIIKLKNIRWFEKDDFWLRENASRFSDIQIFLDENKLKK